MKTSSFADVCTQLTFRKGYCVLGFELSTRDTVEIRRGSSHQRATTYLQGMFCLGTFSRGQRLSVPSPALLCWWISQPSPVAAN